MGENRTPVSAASRPPPSASRVKAPVSGATEDRCSVQSLPPLATRTPEEVRQASTHVTAWECRWEAAAEEGALPAPAGVAAPGAAVGAVAYLRVPQATMGVPQATMGVPWECHKPQWECHKPQWECHGSATSHNGSGATNHNGSATSVRTRTVMFTMSDCNGVETKSCPTRAQRNRLRRHNTPKREWGTITRHTMGRGWPWWATLPITPCRRTLPACYMVVHCWGCGCMHACRHGWVRAREPRTVVQSRRSHR